MSKARPPMYVRSSTAKVSCEGNRNRLRAQVNGLSAMDRGRGLELTTPCDVLATMLNYWDNLSAAITCASNTDRDEYHCHAGTLPPPPIQKHVCASFFSFNKAVTFDGNRADSGSAFAIDGGSLTFKNPEKVTSRNAITYDNEFSVRSINTSFRACSNVGCQMAITEWSNRL